MAPKNPSELARLEAELSFCRESFSKGHHSKATKTYLLREIRRLEQTLGIPSKNYNSDEFTDRS